MTLPGSGHPGASVAFFEPGSRSQVWCEDITMSDGLKLYAIPNHKNGYKALITAQYADVSVETPAYEHGVDNKKPEFLKLNPHGKVEPPPRCHDVPFLLVLGYYVVRSLQKQIICFSVLG